MRRIGSAVALLLALGMGNPAAAQAPYRYQPSRPTVSPYLNLFRPNVGPIPNYHSLVRPQLNQQAFNNRVLVQQAQQNSALRQLESQTGQTSVTPTGKHGWFMTYGRQTFMTGR